MKTLQRVKYYKVTYFDEWLDDNGAIRSGIRSDIIPQEHLQWYKDTFGEKKISVKEFYQMEYK